MRKPLILFVFIGMMGINLALAQNEPLAIGFTDKGQLDYGIGYTNLNPDCVMSSVEKHRQELLTDWEEAVARWASVTYDDDMKTILPTLIQKKAVISLNELNNACIYANTNDTLPPHFSYDMPIFPQYEEEQIVFDAHNYTAGITLFIPPNKGEFKNWYDKTWFLYKNVLQISRNQLRKPLTGNDELEIVQESFFDNVIEGIHSSPEYKTFLSPFDLGGKDSEAKRIGVAMIYLQDNLQLTNFSCEELQEFAEALY